MELGKVIPKINEDITSTAKSNDEKYDFLDICSCNHIALAMPGLSMVFAQRKQPVE